MNLNDQQKSLIRNVLENIMQAAIYRTVWGLPPILSAALAAAAFGLLYYLSGTSHK